MPKFVFIWCCWNVATQKLKVINGQDTFLCSIAKFDLNRPLMFSRLLTSFDASIIVVPLLQICLDSKGQYSLQTLNNVTYILRKGKSEENARFFRSSCMVLLL